MSGDDDDRSWLDREKLSFSERDRLRRERGADSAGDRSDRPHGPAAQARVDAASKQYVKQLDSMFSNSAGGVRGEELEQELRDAHGTPELAAACRAYCEAMGVPEDPALLGLLLDSGDGSLVVAALEALLAGVEAGAIEVTRGTRTQLRILAQDSSDAVAEGAEELLERLADA